MNKKKGFLAIWCEIGAENLAEYRNWLTQEHIADRIYSPGFLGTRLFTSIHNERAHFFLHATESPDVMKAVPYLNILNSPSAWTARIMPKFGPFDRATGERVLKIGTGFGAYATVSRVRCPEVIHINRARDALRRLIDLPDTVGVRLMKTHRDTTDIQSAEKAMRRGGEGDFDYLLVIEALNEVGATSMVKSLPSVLEDALPGIGCHDVCVFKMIYGDAPYEGEEP